jgi:hypothetical protein
VHAGGPGDAGHADLDAVKRWRGLVASVVGKGTFVIAALGSKNPESYVRRS